jgi:hypothetical protein
MARKEATTKVYKVTLSEGLHPFLEHLASIGIYGSTPTEVLRRFAEARIEDLISTGFFERADAAVNLVTTKRTTSG